MTSKLEIDRLKTVATALNNYPGVSTLPDWLKTALYTAVFLRELLSMSTQNNTGAL
jgi:hypothetical protein